MCAKQVEYYSYFMPLPCLSVLFMLLPFAFYYFIGLLLSFYLTAFIEMYYVITCCLGCPIAGEKVEQKRLSDNISKCLHINAKHYGGILNI